MADDTARTDKGDKGFFSRHAKKGFIGVACSALIGVGGFAFDFLGDIGTEVSNIRQEQAIQKQELLDMRQREFDNVWRTLYILREDVQDNAIEIGAMERFVALAMSEGNLDPSDAEILLDSLRSLVDDTPEEEFSPMQLEEFRGIQQKMGGYDQKK